MTAVYCHEYRHILNSTTAVDRALEINKQPRFEMLVLILTFYQNYRDLEHMLHVQAPTGDHPHLFREEMYVSTKDSTKLNQ